MGDIRYHEFAPGYRVGRGGSVGSFQRGDEWRSLKPTPIKSGHLIVGAPDTKYVHILVLEAFVGPKPPGMVGRHRDGDLTNNRVDNLFWGKPPVCGGSPNTVLTAAIVREVKAIHDGTGAGATKIVRELELDPGVVHAVGQVLRGRTWRHVTGWSPRRVPRPPRPCRGDGQKATVGPPKPKKEKTPQTKKVLLNETLVRAIVALDAAKFTPGDIAEMLGLGRNRCSVVGFVLGGNCWNHVTGLPRPRKLQSVISFDNAPDAC